MWPETSHVQPFGIREARREAADLARALEDLEPVLAPLAQPVRRAEARRPGAEDDDAAAHWAGRPFATRRRRRSA